MSTEKKQKALDALKEQLQPLTDNEGSVLSGGFASTSAEEDMLDINGNIPCTTKNSGCGPNTVAGCGGSTAPAK